MTATSCTSTVSSPGATAALAPSSDATTHTTESAMPSGGTQAITPEALALAGSAEPNALQAISQTAKPTNGKALPVTAATEAQKNAEQQTAATAAPTQAAPVKTSLFGSSTPANTGETQVASAATAAAPVKTSLFGNPMRGEGDIQPKKPSSKLQRFRQLMQTRPQPRLMLPHPRSKALHLKRRVRRRPQRTMARSCGCSPIIFRSRPESAWSPSLNQNRDRNCEQSIRRSRQHQHCPLPALSPTRPNMCHPHSRACGPMRASRSCSATVFMTMTMLKPRQLQ